MAFYSARDAHAPLPCSPQGKQRVNNAPDRARGWLPPKAVSRLARGRIPRNEAGGRSKRACWPIRLRVGIIASVHRERFSCVHKIAAGALLASLCAAGAAAQNSRPSRPRSRRARPGSRSGPCSTPASTSRPFCSRGRRAAICRPTRPSPVPASSISSSRSRRTFCSAASSGPGRRCRWSNAPRSADGSRAGTAPRALLIRCGPRKTRLE